MSAPRDTLPRGARAERLLGLEEPKPRSALWVAFAAIVIASSVGQIVLQALRGEIQPEETFMQCGTLFVGLYLLSDNVGALLYLRRGTAGGRTLRAFGTVVFVPLFVASYFAWSWFMGGLWFGFYALLSGGLLAHGAFRFLKGRASAWRSRRGP